MLRCPTAAITEPHRISCSLSFDRHRAAAPVVVGLAEPGLHALERELVAARDHRNLLGVVEELDVLLGSHGEARSRGLESPRGRGGR